MQKDRRQQNWLSDEGIGKYIKFGALPLLVIVLIVVIIRMDAAKTEESAPSESGQAAAVQMAETEYVKPEESGGYESSAAAAVDISRYTLKQDEIPELTDLVTRYCEAKEDCDPQAMADLFGRGELTEDEIAAEKEKMELVKASVKSYENISCYSIEGLTEGSYVIFPYFELRFRETEIWLPQLTWAYAVPDENGGYIMTQDISEEVAAYVGRIGKKEEVAALTAQVEAARQEAIASDPKLQSIYGGAESEVVIGGINE